MKHLASLLALLLAACAPTSSSPPPAPDETVGVVAVPPSLLRALFEASCWRPVDEQARLNPGATYEQWHNEHMFEPVIVASPHVALDEQRVIDCAAAVTADDCALMNVSCFPLSAFIIGTQDAGGDCSADVECASGLCEPDRFGGGCGRCAACRGDWECAADERCHEEGCVVAAADGDVCADDTDCGVDSFCIAGLCAPPAEDGDGCDDFECGPGLACRADFTCGPLPVAGEACSRLGCAEGHRCVDDVCTRPEGQACVDDAACAPGFACDDTDDACHALVVGDVCGVDPYRPCGNDLRCVDDVCVPRLAAGEVCSGGYYECEEDLQCDTSSGGEWRCRSQTYVSLGDDCRESFCADGICLALDDGQDRCLPYDTIERAGGERCRADVLFPVCRYPFVCGDDDDDDGVGACIAPAVAARGEACSTEIRCENELLDTRCVGGVCVARPDVGDACDPYGVDLATQYNGCNALTSYCNVSDRVCERALLGDECSIGCSVGLACRSGRCVAADELTIEQCVAAP